LTEKKIEQDTFNEYVEQLRRENELLRLKEERYHKMISEVADYAIIMLDRQGIILDWNKGAEKINGYRPEEILGKSFRLFYLKEDKDEGLPDKLLKQAAEHGSVQHEGWRIRKDGTRFWGSVTITALHDEANEIFGFSKVTRDLTANKATEDKLASYASELVFKNEELERSQELYQRMVAEVKDYAIILLDENGIIKNWNAGAEAIKGYRPAEIIGKSFETFYTPEDRKAGLPKALLAQASIEGKAIHEGWRVRKDGSRFWGYIVITALHNNAGEIIGFSKVTRDLTEKKHADDQLKANALELDRNNRSLHRLNQEISSFAYVASHDLQEPLRKIRTFVSRISDAETVEQARSLGDKVEGSAARMQKLIQDLLSYSEVSNDKTTFESIDLNEVMKAVITDLEIRITEKDATIKAEQLPVIDGVAFQIHQLFQNILSNALKFSRLDVPPVISIKCSNVHGKDLPLGLAELRPYYMISIADNGIGFDQKDSKKIFNVFQRLRPRGEFGGTGIGLAIVKRVLENHGGFVNVISKISEGSTFQLFFPVK